jgi:two-component system chemotaxis response regulator CheB
MSLNGSALSQTKPVTDPVRVMVVDDSVVARGLMGRWLDSCPELAVVASHRNGKMAVDDVERVNPDVIILDIEMPDMDGLTALPLLLKKCPLAHIIMASTLTRRNAEISLKALSLGASDYIPKPETNSGVSTSVDFRRDLIEKAILLGQRAKSRKALRASHKDLSKSPAIAPLKEPPSVSFSLRPWSRVVPRLLVIGSSTGGPQALAEVLGGLRDALRTVPLLIVQHMPATFTPILAEHMGKAAGYPAREGAHDDIIMPGHIYVAPGGHHMTVHGEGAAMKLALNDGPPVNFCKPAVDPLFESAAAVAGAATLGVVLTGMGSDGGRGVKFIADKGGSVIAQDQASSVVWGMPKAAAESGACNAVLDLKEIAPKIRNLLQGGRP